MDKPVILGTIERGHLVLKPQEGIVVIINDLRGRHYDKDTTVLKDYESRLSILLHKLITVGFANTKHSALLRVLDRLFAEYNYVYLSTLEDYLKVMCNRIYEAIPNRYKIRSRRTSSYIEGVHDRNLVKLYAGNVKTIYLKSGRTIKSQFKGLNGVELQFCNGITCNLSDIIHIAEG